MTSIGNSASQTKSSYSFTPTSCPNQSYIGVNCTISNTPCDMMQPCRHNGTCNNVNTSVRGYICSCLPGYGGIHCQYNYRQCKTNTCWNHGTHCHFSQNEFQHFSCRYMQRTIKYNVSLPMPSGMGRDLL